MKKLMITFAVSLLIITTNCVIGQQKQITLEDIYTNEIFKPKGIEEIYSMNDGEHYTILDQNSIKKYSYKTGELVETILPEQEVINFRGDNEFDFEAYEFNADESQILIPFETEEIYRRSTKSYYYIYDIKSKTFSTLCEKEKQMLADFSPVKNMVAYVQNNNIFIKDFDTGKTKQITTDGLKNHIINGGTDWVYEEEFYLTKGFYWSPDANKIAFYRFDESHVKQYTMLKYGEVYPEVMQFKYPVAGEDNSIINIQVYDLNKESFTKMDIGEDTDIYIPRLEWSEKENELIIIRLNRLQQQLDMIAANATSGLSKIIYSDSNKYYIETDILDSFNFLDGGNKMVILSERSGYNHIYLKDFESGKLTQLTKGEFDVMKIHGYDNKKKIVYYIAAETHPINRDFKKVDLKGKSTFIFKEDGTYTIEFSNNFNYYISKYSNAGTPAHYSLYNSNGKLLRVLEDNANLKAKMNEYNFGKKEFFTFKTSEGIELNAYKILPKNFDPNKKYPVMMYVYGGPGSQTVLNVSSKRDPYYYYLAQQGILVFSVDNRGTGARGEEFKKVTYGELGKYETIDQVEGGKYIAKLPYIDENRVSIFGWSYGGWMSSLCLANKERVFSSAIAVAPVSHYYYYDNVWTERYMGLPKDHKSGYEDNAVLNMAKDIEGNYLIIHGSGDDNVHPQNTYDFVSELIEADKEFEMFIYPNATHSITGGNTDLHIYRQMAKFLKKHLFAEKK